MIVGLFISLSLLLSLLLSFSLLLSLSLTHSHSWHLGWSISIFNSVSFGKLWDELEGLLEKMLIFFLLFRSGYAYLEMQSLSLLEVLRVDWARLGKYLHKGLLDLSTFTWNLLATIIWLAQTSGMERMFTWERAKVKLLTTQLSQGKLRFKVVDEFLTCGSHGLEVFVMNETAWVIFPSYYGCPQILPSSQQLQCKSVHIIQLDGSRLQVGLELNSRGPTQVDHFQVKNHVGRKQFRRLHICLWACLRWFNF